ncbi:MAG: Isochorismatase family protein YecD [Candidatus Erwinia impunctatus]|nr:Isochorismatase family protein YecD [Culicoides impunctatus]
MLTLNPSQTALVLIDLQEGILPFAKGPYSADDVVAWAAEVADSFRAAGAPVILVRVGWHNNFGDALKQPVDKPMPSGVLPDNWWTFPAALRHQAQDILVMKHQWGAFYGTDLELQLRRRGIDTVVLGGISTNIGVESTARDAWERGFQLVFAEQLCTAGSSEEHQNSFATVFPRIGRVRSNAEIISALHP